MMTNTTKYNKHHNAEIWDSVAQFLFLATEAIVHSSRQYQQYAFPMQSGVGNLIDENRWREITPRKYPKNVMPKFGPVNTI